MDLLLAGALTLPVSAAIALDPDHSDGSVFMYIGQMWADGVLPYTSVFDNKPPGIFALIALATRVHRSLWVVACIEFLFALGCIATVRAILQRMGAPRGAVFAGCLCTSLAVNLRIYYAGNMPESYLLWPMAASTLAFLIAMQSGKARYVFLAGFCSGIACLFKPFGLSALMAQVAFTLLQELPKRRLIAAGSSISMNLAGAVAAWIPVCAYFWLHGGLKEMLDASFLYNMHYGLASQPSVMTIPSLLAVRMLPLSTMVACFALGAYSAYRRDAENALPPNEYWDLVLLWFGFGLLLVLAAGRGYEQYFLSLTPMLAISAALFLWLIQEHGSTAGLQRSIVVLIVAPLLFAYLPGASPTIRNLLRTPSKTQPDDLMVEEIKRVATPSSSLLVWGYVPWLLYSTHLRSTLRYPSTHYIYDSPRSYDQIGGEILSGISKNPPDFVVVSGEPPDGRWSMQADPVKERFEALLNKEYTEVAHVELLRLYKHR